MVVQTEQKKQRTFLKFGINIALWFESNSVEGALCLESNTVEEGGRGGQEGGREVVAHYLRQSPADRCQAE